MNKAKKLYPRSRPRVWLGHLVVGALFFSLGLMILHSFAPASPEVLPPGTALTVRLTQPLSSRSARLGDEFEAQVEAAQGINGVFPAPLRTRAQGRCIAARAGEEQGRPGYLRVALTGLWDEEGNLSPLETTTISLSGKARPNPRPKSNEKRLRASTAAHPQAPAPDESTSNLAEAVVTREMSLTFVLLKPAVVSARRSTR